MTTDTEGNRQHAIAYFATILAAKPDDQEGATEAALEAFTVLLPSSLEAAGFKPEMCAQCAKPIFEHQVHGRLNATASNGTVVLNEAPICTPCFEKMYEDGMSGSNGMRVTGIELDNGIRLLPSIGFTEDGEELPSSSGADEL